MAERYQDEFRVDISTLDVDHVVDTVNGRTNGGPAFIHVCGASASGKSTVAEGLAQILPDAQVFPMDAYLAEGLWDQTRVFNHESPNPDRPYIAGISPEIWDMDIMQAHMTALSEGIGVNMPIFDETQKDRVGYKPFEPGRFIIVEGVHAFSDEFRGFSDYGILVIASLHDRLSRKMVRTHAVHGLSDVDEVVSRYLSKDEPVNRVYAQEHQAFASQVVVNPANPRVHYAHLPTSSGIVTQNECRALVPKPDTGTLRPGEVLGIFEDGGPNISYSVDERVLVRLAMQRRTVDLLTEHYELVGGAA